MTSPLCVRRSLPGVIRRFILALALTPTLAAADPASEAPKPEPRVQFVDMSEMLIGGAVVRPQVLMVDSRERARFERLFQLRRKVLPDLQRTARDRALR